MADDTTVSNSPLSNYAVRADDIGDGKLRQVVRLDLGGDLTESLASSTVPVSGSVTVSGTVAVSGVTGEVDVTPAAPAANSYLPVRLTDGSAFYTASGGGSAATYTIRMDEGATYTYIGKANAGTLTSAASWQISRLTNADNTLIFADGDTSFDNVWDNRAILSYS
jgi:hypothetical protein